MKEVILILFAITLLYIAISNRLRGFVKILAFQGLLLFILAFIQLIEVTIINLVFVLLETLVFKTIALPLFLDYVIKKNKISRETEPYVPYFLSLLITSAIIIASFILIQQIEGLTYNTLFFVVALSTLFTGIYIIISRKKLITHLMGYIVIENGVFILSLAIGSEMPMMVNTGILIDLFIGVLVMGIFVNKIGDVFKEADAHYISQMKD
jgi:hydrogenase-4 component E